MLHTVAKLHYEAELSQVMIAKQLGVSTATISRLLRRARSEGIVRIEVRDLVAPDTLGAALAERLALRRVLVVEAPAAGVGAALATPLGALLRTENPGPGSVIAVGWGRAIRAVMEAGLAAAAGRSGGARDRWAATAGGAFPDQRVRADGGRAYGRHAAFHPRALPSLGRSAPVVSGRPGDSPQRGAVGPDRRGDRRRRPAACAERARRQRRHPRANNRWSTRPAT